MTKLSAILGIPALVAGLALAGAASAAPVGSSATVAAPDSAFVQVKSSKMKAKMRRHHGPPAPVSSDRQ